MRGTSWVLQVPSIFVDIETHSKTRCSYIIITEPIYKTNVAPVHFVVTIHKDNFSRRTYPDRLEATLELTRSLALHLDQFTRTIRSRVCFNGSWFNVRFKC